MNGERGIEIGRDAHKNTIISGDGNVVIIQATMTSSLEETHLAPAIGMNPYQGLSAFHEEDAERFFGREKLTEHLWDVFRKLHEPQPGADPPVRILPIMGPSGSGKSSVIRAGLIPELARRPLPGLRRSHVALFTPGDHPLESLAGILARIATNDISPVAKTREFTSELRITNERNEYDGLRRIADSLPDIAPSPLIILVDQFEEIYSLSDDPQECDAFVQNLMHAAFSRSTRVSVILTLRSDFLGATQRHSLLNQTIARQAQIIPAMSEEELRKAITDPARRAGHPLDEAVVALLVSETMGRQGALPMLQSALTSLWEGMAEGIAPAVTLKRIGGVGGALAGEAQGLFDSLNATDQNIARRAFLGLVQLGEGTKDTRRRTKVSELVAHGEQLSHVVEVLRTFSQRGSRLITFTSDPDGAEALEVTHEALFEHWDSLRQWLDSSRDDLRFHRRLMEASEHWHDEGRPDGLLWRSPDLDSLCRFHDRACRDMTSIEMGFFQSSVRKKRRTRLVRSGVIAFLVILAVVATVAAYMAKQSAYVAKQARDQARTSENIAKVERNKAVGRLLTTQASLLADQGKGDDAILKAGALAVESWQRFPNADAHATAAKLLQWFPVVRIGGDQRARSFSLLAFSPDARFLAAASPYEGIRLFETASGRQLAGIKEDSFVFHVQFSSDSRFILIRAQGSTRMISTESAEEVFSSNNKGESSKHLTQLGKGSYTGMATMSPDGRWLARTANDGITRKDRITVTDMHTGAEVCQIEHQMNRQQGDLIVSFSPDGKTLLIKDWSSFHLFEIPDGRERTRITMSDALEGYFIGNGRWLAVDEVKRDDYDKTLHLLDPGTGSELSAVHLGKRGRVEFSRDGRFMVTTDDNDNEIRLLDVPTGQERGRWQSSAVIAPFDSSGWWLVLKSKEGVIRLVDAASGEEVRRIEPGCNIDQVNLQPERDILVVACEDGRIQTFKASTGEETARFQVDGFSFVSPDARLIVSQDERRGVLRLNETSTGREFGRIAISGPAIRAAPQGIPMPGGAVFSNDGRYLALPSSTGGVQMIDLSAAYSRLKLEAVVDGEIALSRDGRFLAFAGQDHLIRAIDVATGREVGAFRPDETAYPVAISDDGRSIVTQHKSLLTLSEVETGREVARLQPYGDWIPSINKISPDGNFLLIQDHQGGERGGGHYLVASSSLKEIMRFPGEKLCCHPVFSPDGRVVAMANRVEEIVQLFNATSGAERLRINGKSCCPQFSPDGLTLALMDDIGSFVRLLDTSTGTERMRIPTHSQGGPGDPGFSPDGLKMARIRDDEDGNELSVELFDVGTGRELCHSNSGVFRSGSGDRFEPLTRFATAFSRDSRFFAVGAAGGAPARLFEAATGKELASIDLGTGFAGVAFSPDGRRVAAASNNGAMRLLDVEKMKVVGSSQHPMAITHLEFSPDGSFLVTSGAEGTALMTETQSGKEIARFEHGEPLTEAHFSVDGQSLLTASSHKIKIWPADPEWPFKQLCARQGRNLSLEEWRAFIGESESWKATCSNWH